MGPRDLGGARAHTAAAPPNVDPWFPMINKGLGLRVGYVGVIFGDILGLYWG